MGVGQKFKKMGRATFLLSLDALAGCTGRAATPVSAMFGAVSTESPNVSSGEGDASTTVTIVAPRPFRITLLHRSLARMFEDNISRPRLPRPFPGSSPGDEVIVENQIMTEKLIHHSLFWLEK